jgi:hypothetical protein
VGVEGDDDVLDFVPRGVGLVATGEVAVGGRALEAVILVGEEGATLGLLASRLAFAFRDVTGVEVPLMDLLGVLTLMKVRIFMIVG